MKKIKIFAMLLFLFSAQTAFSGEISDEIPENYKFRFFNREDAPNKELTDFDPNFNPNDANACNHNCSQDNEVQGITSFYEKYWVLSKNKWFYVYALDENDELFS
ncbi:hypothetical protein J5690_05265 [bacterium]|nr:hypothetical protein [bacterium]